MPNVPNVIGDAAVNDKTIRFFFKSSFTLTYLIIEISDGEITAFSDNFSVITIVKDQLSADASQRKITLEINSDLN